MAESVSQALSQHTRTGMRCLTVKDNPPVQANRTLRRLFRHRGTGLRRFFSFFPWDRRLRRPGRKIVRKDLFQTFQADGPVSQTSSLQMTAVTHPVLRTCLTVFLATGEAQAAGACVCSRRPPGKQYRPARPPRPQSRCLTGGYCGKPVFNHSFSGCCLIVNGGKSQR